MRKSFVMSKIKGFTLVEILVVATIIGLLAAGAAVSYSSISKNSRDAKRKADLEQIRAALEMYRSNNNTYPTTFTLNCSSTGSLSDATRTYLSTIPKDPKCTAISYNMSISSSDYTLGAYLEGSASTCGVTLSCTVANCNYCLGPYGQK